MLTLKYTLCLDIGGTKTAIALFNNSGQIIKKKVFLTNRSKSASFILNNLYKAINEVKGKKNIKAIGIAIAGVVDPKTGKPIYLKKFSNTFQKINLKTTFEKKYKAEVFIDNDATLFTYAEHKIGQAQKYNNIIGLTLGTGIGGGIIIDGKIYNGKGFASEFGHMILEEESDVKCSCNKFGHFESLASGTAMINLYKKLTGLKKDTFEIEKLANQKDNDAIEVINIMSKYLATGIVNIIHSLNPDAIVIGGGLVRVKLLWNQTIKEIKQKLIHKELEKTKIIKSQMEDDAVLYGAYFLTK